MTTVSSRVLIAGANGMLGTALQRVLGERHSDFAAPPKNEFDISDESHVRAAVQSFATAGGELLVNAAAYTNVEAAEDDSERAYLVNETGARLLAEAARDAGLGFVHVSTDFVFDGSKVGAYVESDTVDPLSVYGKSKLAGEIAVSTAYPEALIVRTAWVFGPGGVNFPSKILDLAAARPSLSVVTDEVGSPTYTIDLAEGILDLVDAGVSGITHLAGAGVCSRFELAAEVLRLAGVQCELVPVTAGAFPSKAARPANSQLDCTRASTFGVVMPEWRDALGRFLGDRAASLR